MCICGEFTTEVSIIAECQGGGNSWSQIKPMQRLFRKMFGTKSSTSNRGVITGSGVVRSGITISLELTHRLCSIDTSRVK